MIKISVCLSSFLFWDVSSTINVFLKFVSGEDFYNKNEKCSKCLKYIIAGIMKNNISTNMKAEIPTRIEDFFRNMRLCHFEVLYV